jgi:hypothetical protein
MERLILPERPIGYSEAIGSQDSESMASGSSVRLSSFCLPPSAFFFSRNGTGERALTLFSAFLGLLRH